MGFRRASGISEIISKMKQLQILVIILSALLKLGACQEIEIIPQVDIDEGTVRGVAMRSRDNREYISFKGMPYAEKPERFKLAPNFGKWEGILNATQDPAPCAQMFIGDGGKMEPFGSEDCLYINVYTPHKNEDKNYPVLIWIHGGAFVVGSSREYGPEYFMDEDVVLVTFNYRLGALGFLYNEDESIPGNLGLKDQLQAIKWVRRNIKHFGGDIYNMTIIGENAGAISVHLHLLTISSKGNFHRAIAQSGNALAPWGLNRHPKWHAARYAMALGCPPKPTSKMVECLSRLEVYKLVEAQLMMPSGPLSGFHWAPVIEVDRGVDEYSAFILKDPVELIKEKNITSEVPLLTGVMKNEGTSIVSSIILPNRELMHYMNTNWAQVSPKLLFYYDPLLHMPKLEFASEKIRKFYFHENPIGPETRQRLTHLISDRYFNYPIYAGAMAHSLVSPTYAYLFTFHEERSMPHQLLKPRPDIVQVTVNPYLFNMTNRPELNKKEAMFSKNLIKLWVSFAATGKPRKIWGAAKAWPPVSTSNSLFNWYNLDHDTQLLEGPFHWRMKFWEHLLATDLNGMI